MSFMQFSKMVSLAKKLNINTFAELNKFKQENNILDNEQLVDLLEQKTKI